MDVPGLGLGLGRGLSLPQRRRSLLKRLEIGTFLHHAAVGLIEGYLSAEYLSGAGAAYFPLPAQTYFCDSSSAPFPAPRPPAPVITSAHRSVPAHQVFGPLRSGFRSTPASVFQEANQACLKK